ncbi:ribonuclease HI [Egbenema bharatensis]|uniref:ribonuclease HI n=1 Tax=Egbenema bharatensis TaxID=3463334 RepID=UPI003A8648F0
MTVKQIKNIYTDGACSGNPGPGGWGTVIYFADGSVHELGGSASQTTNNRMELQAAIGALEYLLSSQQTEPITLYTDSEYVKNGITKWVKGWKAKGWKTSAGKPVLNQDLWETLDQLNQKAMRQIPALQWQYVKGHSGNTGNDRCDTIARTFSLGQTPSLTTLSHPPLSTSPSPLPQFEAHATDETQSETIQSSDDNSQQDNSLPTSNLVMVDSTTSSITDGSDLPREVRVAQLRNLVETLHMADEIARLGYLITSSELADLMDVNASAVTSRGDNWVWRNWVVSRVRREGNQILWQLERVD